MCPRGTAAKTVRGTFGKDRSSTEKIAGVANSINLFQVRIVQIYSNDFEIETDDS